MCCRPHNYGEKERKRGMDHERYRNYLAILKEELIPALGCTEPIALAYAAAKAKEIFEHVPERMEVWCSGNIIKNVKSVTVPNSGGDAGHRSRRSPWDDGRECFERAGGAGRR